MIMQISKNTNLLFQKVAKLNWKYQTKKNFQVKSYYFYYLKNVNIWFHVTLGIFKRCR